MASIDFKALGSHLLNQARTLLPLWLPGGKFEGSEYMCADLRGGPGTSLRYNIDKALGSDFATGESLGDMINLYARINNIKMFEAAKQLMESEGFSSVERVVISAKPEIKYNKPTDIIVPPAGTPLPENFHHYKHGDESVVYEYTDGDGNPIFFVARYETPAGKQFAPWSFSESKGWCAKGFPEPRPIYNLKEIIANPDLRILIVEGEKAANAAKQICGKNYVVTTWHGGSNAWNKSDWSPIYGRNILIWPDRDFQKNKNKTEVLPYEQQPGTKAAVGLAELLYKHCPEIKVINVEQETIAGFDAADAVTGLGWTTREFLAWARQYVRVVKDANTVVEPEVMPNHQDEAQSFVDWPVPLDDAPMPGPNDEPDVINVQVSKSMAAMLPDLDNKMRPLNTFDNFVKIMEMNKIVFKYNIMKKIEEVIVPGDNHTLDNRANAALSTVYSACGLLKFPTSMVNTFMTKLCDTHAYHPIADWIRVKPWDGVSRLKELYDTIKSTDDEFKEILMKRWMVSAVASIFETNGTTARGVLVFQGRQNLGKTKWIKMLVPKVFDAVADGMVLRPDDKDSVKQVVGHWIVELGELDATFRKADVARLKAFITKDKDILRPAYAKAENTYVRRTVFFGSVNPEAFLGDDTGNSRYWTVKCLDINHNHNVDMQQVWAEVYENLYLKGEPWYLQPHEMDRLNGSNESFITMDAIEEMLLNDLDWENPMSVRTWKNATDVLKMLDVKNIGKPELTKCGAVLKRILAGHPDRMKKMRGTSYYDIPSIRSNFPNGWG